MDCSPQALFGYLVDDLKAAGYEPGNPDSDWWPGASATGVACLRLERALFKKLNDDLAPDADEKCLLKFMASDKRCHDWQYDPQSAKEEELFGLLRQEIDQFLHPEGEPLVSSYFDLLGRGRAGPGASLGATGVDFYSKFFSSKLTATSTTLYTLYNEYVCWFPDWVDAELSRSLRLGAVDVVRGNRLSFVRKTRDISRSICTEPSLNMFYQLGLGEIIADRLRQSFGIDLKSQADQNRAMARWGSIDGSICTIDLESASDSVSLNLCRELFPGWFLAILEELRSAEVDLGQGTWHALSMVSSMGNGFTFPLQTMLFACIVRAAARFCGVKLRRCGGINTGCRTEPDPSEPYDVPYVRSFGALRDLSVQPGEATHWGVFGDDILCSSELGRVVVDLLSLCGFIVNRTKSYFVGPFRESCGGDFYMGHPVRGVYIRSLRTTQDRYVAINRLNEWTAVTGVSLPRSVGYLVDTVRNLAVPYDESDVAGIRTIRPPSGSYSSERQHYVYRHYVPHTRELEVGESRVYPSRDYWGEPPKPRLFNPSGLLLSFLAGYIRNFRISVALKQGGVMRYRTRTWVSHSWGAVRPGSVFATDLSFWTPRIREALDENLRNEI